MLIDKASLWAAETNTYVVAEERGSLAVIVDAPPDPEGVVELLGRHGLTASVLLLTHGHVDHMGGAGQVVRSTGAVAHIHPDDDFLTMDPETQMRAMFGMVPPGDFAPPETKPLGDGDVLEVGGVVIEVLHTPGHTPGHVCFRVESEGVLFSGDQLFAGSIGRTDLPGGDYQALMDSMGEKVVGLPGETAVLPGHGPATTIGRELSSNPFLEQFRH